MEAATKPATKTTGKLESFNKATGEIIGSVDTITPDQVQGIVDEVALVQPFWAELSFADRSRYLKRVALEIVDATDEIADLVAREQGKPLTEAVTMEVMSSIDAINWIADNAAKFLSDERIGYTQPYLKYKKSRFSYEPMGVVGVIAPWNYPWTIPINEIAMALAAGNGVVFKPASLTCLIGDKLQEIFDRAGLPEGLLRTIHGGGAVGQGLVESSARKIFFTGSVEVGRHIGETCAKLMKGSVLELGGKDPQVVLSDANIKNAIHGAVWGGFANGGQTCSGIERVYVMHDVADEFIAGVVAGAQKLKVGDPLQWDTEIGPMTSADQFDLVKELVDDAVANGATMHCGGPVEIEGFTGKFYSPTVLTGVNHGMRIMKEEIFGAVVPIMTVDSEEEAVRLANDSEFGLGASIWTRDLEKGDAMARKLEAGSVWVNDHLYSFGACQCSWGGVKDSGLGRSHSKFGFYECVDIKHIGANSAAIPSSWWYPYSDYVGPSIRATVKALYGPRGQRIDALREASGPLMKYTKNTAKRMAGR